MNKGYRLLLAFLVFLAMTIHFSPPAWGQAFEGCVENIDNATVVVPQSVQADVGNAALEPGDEIAVFTEDGTCAGYGVWDEESLSIAAAGKDDRNPDGFDIDEKLHFRVWEASSGTVYEATVTYESCDGDNPLCSDSGQYQTNRLYSLQELEANTTLPVELMAFDATVEEDGALLQWETASETNNAGFEVQHRAPQAASDAWTRRAFVEGQGTTNEAQRYTHRLNDLAPGTHHFRLKQMDLDGGFEYSTAVEVEVTMSEPFELVAPYPNPFRQHATFTLRVAEAQHVNIMAYNQLGQRVATLHEGDLIPNTEHTFRLEGQQLSSGMYFIQIRGEQFSTTERAVLVR